MNEPPLSESPLRCIAIDRDRTAELLRGRILKAVLVVAAASLLLIALRGFILGGLRPWPDTAASLLALAGYYLVGRRPAWVTAISWIFLALIYLNVLDGILPWHPEVITTAHVLLPLLVFYGAVLGDLRLSSVSALAVLTIYGLTAWHYWPLQKADLLLLTNVTILAAVFTLLAFVVWWNHDLLLQEVRLQNLELRTELETNRKLQAVIFHDISNPLQGIRSTVGLMREGVPPPHALDRLEQMTDQIHSIIAYVRVLTDKGRKPISLLPFRIAQVLELLPEIFQERLREKGLQLSLEMDEDLKVQSHPDILLHSVLANLLSNAIKFSPAGARIHVSAQGAGDQVRVLVANPGPRIPDQVLRDLQAGGAVPSGLGTLGERGDGNGLRIARETIHRLGGELRVPNDSVELGQVWVEVLLPGGLH